MRKITIDAVNAFMNNKPFSRGNTKVNVYKTDGVTILTLHDNEIAMKCHDTGKLTITNAGWFSKTTRERLNGLPDVSIKQKDYKWYLNGELWDGLWTEVK